MSSEVVERYNEVKKRIVALSKECDRLEPPNLCVVTKLKPVEPMIELYEAGHRVFGENYVAEMAEKAAQLPADVQYVFIGHLQSNKVPKLINEVPQLVRVETVDSEKLAAKLDQGEWPDSEGGRPYFSIFSLLAVGQQRPDRPLEVLIQVNTSSEESKSGVDGSEAVEELSKLVRYIVAECPNLRWKGLMTIASPDTVKAAAEFKGLRKTGEEIVKILQGEKLMPETLFYSFGMTDDMKEAIANGSSELRIGTAIMGSRPARDQKPLEAGQSSAL